MCEDIDLTTIGTDEYIRWIKEDRKQQEDKGIILFDDRISGMGSGWCMFCIHFDADKYINSRLHKCAAFDDIPLVIWKDEFDHNNPYPNDKGIMFSRKPETKRIPS